jgi:Exocyst complex component Sec10.
MNLTDFQDENFNSSEFVNNLIDKALSDISFVSLEKCDLSHLNKTIEIALRNLESLKDEISVEMETLNLEKELNHVSIEKDQDKLLKEMEAIRKEFNSLEQKLIRFSDKSITLGSHLGALDKEKEDAILTSELIEYFMAFNNTKLDDLPEVFKDSTQYLTAAKYIYYLSEVAKNLTTSEFNIATQNITNKYYQIKSRISMEFNDAYFKKDKERIEQLMPHLNNFGLMSEIAFEHIKTQLRAVSSDFIFENKTFEENKKSLENCYRNLLRILSNEFTTEENFFMEIFSSRNVEIIKMFISYCFENYIGKSLNKTLTDVAKNEESYLKYYELFYVKTEELIQEIYKMNSPYSSELNEVARAYFHSIFDDYQANYFNHEKSYLVGLLENYLGRITKIMSNQKDKDVSTMSYIGKGFSFAETVVEKAKLSKEEAQQRVKQLQDVLMNDATELLFIAFEQSAQRCHRISKIDEKNLNTIELVEKFLEYFAYKGLYLLIEFTSQLVPDLNRKTALNENYFEIIFNLNSIVQRVEISLYKTTQNIIKVKQYEKLIEKKEKIMHDLEQRIEASIKKAITSLELHAHKQLVNHEGQNEYVIKDKKKTPENPSNSCRDLLKFLRPYVNEIQKAYSENNKKRILNMLGIKILRVIMDFYSEIKLNQKGLMQLSIDESEYTMFFEEFEEETVKEMLEVFKCLINIYKIHADDLNSYIENEEKLQLAAPDLIEKYVNNRPQK